MDWGRRQVVYATVGLVIKMCVRSSQTSGVCVRARTVSRLRVGNNATVSERVSPSILSLAVTGNGQS